MKIWAMYSHLNWYEWIMIHKKHLWEEIETVIKDIDWEKFKTKVSKEKTMNGKNLYSPIDLNKEFKNKFENLWWSENRTSYRVTDDYNLIMQTMHSTAEEQKKIYEEHNKIPILSYNQTDFEKDRIAIEVQFWKYSFIAYDLFVKHLAFYVWNTIDLWIEILPMKSMQSCMSSWPWYYESALYDLARQWRWVPAVPLILIWITE